MVTINEYLDNILNDFKQYISSDVKLCDLKDVHFDAGRIPDYSNIHVQQLYLLRYAYAYAFEYKRMYRSLLKRMHLGEEIRVTSIGCGSMIDYWALAHVVPSTCKIRYRGIDVINWSYQMEKRPKDDVQFIQADVLDLFLATPELVADAYIFPKSISEFSHDDIKRISEAFGKKVPEKNTVYFLFSLRTEDGSMERDLNSTRQIFDTMIDSGFATTDQYNSYTVLKKDIQGKKICKVDDDFRHPGDVIDFLKDLHTCCMNYTDNNCKSDCKDRLGRWPILNCQQARWQLFEFQKRNKL